SINIADKPGALGDLAQRIGSSGGNIVEIEHQRIFTEKSAKSVTIETMVEVVDRAAGERLVVDLGEAGYPTKHL
ncbi:MAG: threonine ammonia-lyase, partial [Proteobacteria bacterium]|nr:threonine ammonia-lyase [Pseudomonadota bacterium]